MAVATQKIVIHADDRTAAAVQSFLRNSQKMDKALNNTADTMRKTTRQGRAQMAQLGHQVQDISVQYQMGMNPLMILGQQGSQVASVFGTRGPMIGAFIAIAAVMGQQLMPSLFEATKSLEALKKVNDEAADSLFNTSKKAKVLSDSLIEMARADSVRAVIDLRKQVIDLRKNIDDARNSIQETGDQLFSTFGYGVGEDIKKIGRELEHLEKVSGKAFKFDDAINLGYFSELRRFITKVREEFGFSKEASVDFSKAIFNLVRGKQGSVEELDAVMREISSTMGDQLNPAAIQVISDFMKITEVMKQSQDNISVSEALIKTLEAGFTDFGDTTDETKDKTKDFNKSIQDQATYLRDSMKAISDYLSFRENYLAQDRTLLKLQKDLAKAREHEDQVLIDAISKKIDLHKKEAEAKRLSAIAGVGQQEIRAQRERNQLLLDGRSATKKMADESARLIQVIGMGRSMETWDSAEIEAYRVAMEKLNDQLFKVKDITPEVTKVTNEAKDAYFNFNRELKDLGDNAIRSVEDNLVGLISGTVSAKDAFRSMAASIINDMIRMQVRAQYMPIIRNLFSAGIGQISTASTYGTNIGSQQTTMLAAQDAGLRANGGPVSGGKPYIVGERGPELMIPTGSGRVIPNNKLGGGDNINITLNVSAGVSDTIRAEMNEMLPRIQQTATAAVLNAKLRGGAFSSAF